MKLRLTSILILAITLSNGCRQDEFSSNEFVDRPSPTIVFNGDLFGLVTDERNNPLPLTTITVGNTVTEVDSCGMFYLKDISFDSDKTLVKANRSNYIDGYKIISAQNGTTNYVKINLRGEPEANFIEQGGFDELVLDEVRFSTFNSSYITKETGNLYEGAISLKVRYYNPPATRFSEFMPGNLRGENTDGDEVQIQTQGIMYFELFGENNEALELMEGSSMNVRFPVPNDVGLINYPDVSATWRFNTETGIWEEESIAEFEEGYFFQINRTGFWACGIAVDLVTIEGRLFVDDFPLTNNTIEIISEDFMSSSGYTDVNGNFRITVPRDRSLLLRSSPCGQLPVTTELNSFTGDASLGDLNITSGANKFRLTGSFSICNAPAEDAFGLVQGSQGVLGTFIINNGMFDYTLFNCENDSGVLQLKSPEGNSIRDILFEDAEQIVEENLVRNIISGTVWLENSNQVNNEFDFDIDEILGEVQVNLLNTDGEVVRSTLTTNGIPNFIFSNIEPGSYRVRVINENSVFTFIEKNNDIENGSNVDIETGISDEINIEGCGNSFKINAGLQ